MVIYSWQISDEYLFMNRKMSRYPRKTTFDTLAWPTWFEFSHCPIILEVSFVWIGSSGTSWPWKIKGSMFLPQVEYQLHSSTASCLRRKESSTSRSSRLQDCHIFWLSSVSLNKFRDSNLSRLSWWPRCLSCRSTAAWLLGSWVRIPLKLWMFVLFVLWIAAPPTSWSLVRTSPTGCVWFRNFNSGAT
jgi:hypothetical protein